MKNHKSEVGLKIFHCDTAISPFSIFIFHLKIYKEVKEDELIPAHLLGNMWAQTWMEIERFLLPYPGEPTLDVTPYLKNNLKDAKGMFEEAEKFFTSLGWRKLPKKFWTHSLFVEPKDRKVINATGHDPNCYLVKCVALYF